MRLPLFRSKAPGATATRAERARPAAAGDDSSLVEAARTRARRRLIGALVLLVIGVVGFPIVFETQPRPLPVDTPILTPQTAAVRREPPPLAPPRPAVQPVVEVPADDIAAAPAASSPPPRPTPTAEPVVITERAAPASAPAPTPSATPPVAKTPPVVATVASSPAPTPAPAPAGNGRFVVQVGAYSDPATLRDTRAKVEKLGLKTYTQVVGSEAGPRTRVRLGPYATRDEADAAAARLKRAGLPANILAL